MEPEVLRAGGGGVRVRTEGQLETVLATVERERGRLALIDAVVDRIPQMR